MKQTDLGLDLSTRRTRKQNLLEEMNQVMPWSDLLSLKILQVINAKLAAHGLLLKAGTVVDATLIAASRGVIDAGVSQGGKYSLMPSSQIEFWT